MSVVNLLSFSLPILTGTLIAHLLWTGRNDLVGLLLKLSLGIGLGLGISSLLYFPYLIFFGGSPYFFYVELAVFFAVLAAAALKQGKTARTSPPRLDITSLQIAILSIAALVFVSSFLGMVNYSRQRARGDWDAWMIYNRAARFIYRAPDTWQDAFSQEMDVIFHADYPPLLALNIASRWDILNQETSHVPLFQGILFSFASLGLSFAALASLKSLGQAGLGVILLSGVSFFLHEGGRQTADMPIAFYVLSTIVFLFFYHQEQRVIFMVFAGFTAGLAAWTKNEGILFILISAGVISIAAVWKRSLRVPLLYFAGMVLPLAALFYFKFQLAPPSEFASSGADKIIQDMTDIARHQLIFNSFKAYLLHDGGWNNIGIFLILSAYLLLFYARRRENSGAILPVLAILACQVMGYYVFYLISPYDLKWHIEYSLPRLFVHIYPSTVFVILAASQTAETVFSSSIYRARS